MQSDETQSIESNEDTAALIGQVQRDGMLTPMDVASSPFRHHPSPTFQPAPVVDIPVEQYTASLAEADTPAEEVPVPEESPTEYVPPKPLGVNPHSEMSKPAYSALKAGQHVTEDNSIALMGVTNEEFNHLLESYPNIDFSRGEDGAKWAEVIKAAQSHLQVANAFMASLSRDNSHWRQSVTSGGEQLAPGRPKLGESTSPDGRLTGAQAMMKLQAALGLGGIVRVPLWHTGLWVSIKAPAEAALLELERRIANEKITLGRQTNGLVFSNSSVYTQMYLVEFALAHIYEASYKYEHVNELKKVIRITDINVLLWGLLCTIYPHGYPYQKPCLTDPTKCLHVVEELVDLGKLIWTDERALTEKQRKHMVQKSTKFTKEQLDAYQAEHQFGEAATVHLSEQLVMELKVPTIAEFEESGFTWVDTIVKQTDQAFAGTITGQERDTYILDQAAMTSFRQYSHWIDRLVLGGTEKIDDRSSIDDSISVLTAQDEVFKAFFEGMQQFIDRSTISLIGVPRFSCPKCGAPMGADEKAHPHLLAVNVSNLFFTILDQRISKVLSR